MILDGIAGARFLFSGQVAHFIAILKAHFNFYSCLGSTLKKRRQLKRDIKHYATKGIYSRSLVADYYLRGIKMFTQLDSTKLL